MNAAVRGTAATAQDIATMTLPRSPQGDEARRVRSVSDLATAMVDLKTYEYQAQGSVRVMQTASNMVGTLIDELV